jgi:hypothetical protein
MVNRSTANFDLDQRVGRVERKKAFLNQPTSGVRTPSYGTSNNFRPRALSTSAKCRIVVDLALAPAFAIQIAGPGRDCDLTRARPEKHIVIIGDERMSNRLAGYYMREAPGEFGRLGARSKIATGPNRRRSTQQPTPTEPSLLDGTSIAVFEPRAFSI